MIPGFFIKSLVLGAVGFISLVCCSLTGAEDYQISVSCFKFESNGSFGLDSCTRNVCVPKCCGLKQVWDLKAGGCANVTNGIFWSPSFYELITDNCAVAAGVRVENSNSTDVEGCGLKNEESMFMNESSSTISPLLENISRPSHEEVLHNCTVILLPFSRIKGIAAQRFRLLLNGSVILRDKYGSWHEVRAGKYCIDGIQKSAKKPYTGEDAHNMIFVCESDYKFKRAKAGIPVIYATMLFTASFLLFITAAVYLLLWKQNGVYEWLIFCDVISNLFMIIFVATGHSISRDPEKSILGTTRCIAIGAIAHFFFLAAFAWTFVICFELWWTFRRLGVVSRKSFGLRRLAAYQLPGWGVPGIIVSIGLTLDSFYGLGNMEMDCSPVITPNYGLLNCYLSKPAQGPYLFYPIGVIIACNILFFVLTVLQMRKHKQSTQSALQSSESRVNKSQAQLTTVFAKLFLIMGLSWIFALVAWIVSSKKRQQAYASNTSESEGTGPPLNWIVYDIVIILQALAIFLIFTCKTEIVSDLSRRYSVFRVIFNFFRRRKPVQLKSESTVNIGIVDLTRSNSVQT